MIFKKQIVPYCNTSSPFAVYRTCGRLWCTLTCHWKHYDSMECTHYFMHRHRCTTSSTSLTSRGHVETRPQHAWQLLQAKTSRIDAFRWTRLQLRRNRQGHVSKTFPSLPTIRGDVETRPQHFRWLKQANRLKINMYQQKGCQLQQKCEGHVHKTCVYHPRPSFHHPTSRRHVEPCLQLVYHLSQLNALRIVVFQQNRPRLYWEHREHVHKTSPSRHPIDTSGRLFRPWTFLNTSTTCLIHLTSPGVNSQHVSMK